MLQAVRRARLLRARRVWAITAAVLMLHTLAAGAARAQPAPEPPPACDGLILRLNDTLTGVCRAINGGFACYGLDAIDAAFRPGVTATFGAPGNRAALDAFTGLSTDEAGAGLMVSGADSGRVKMIVFGGAEMAAENRAEAGVQGSVFTLTTSNNRPVCGRAASGMMLQTSGRPGRITVNGVTIELASTALIVVGPEPLFDQDPRDQRRYGRQNPDAPLCSGFDSDCSFGDSACAAGDRLVYGPFCREDAYPSIHPGLYRVTLYGAGQVTAGATDFAAFGERFMLAGEDLTLPADYTFCWPGLEEGGSGFETIVEAAEAGGARVDRITVDYLGEDCAADPATLGTTRDSIGFMTIYNVEGSVRVSGPMGAATIPPGQRLRVHYDGATPVRLDGPTGADYAVSAPLTQYLTYGANGEGGLPAIVTDAGGEEPDAIESVTTMPPERYCLLAPVEVRAAVRAAPGAADVTLWRYDRTDEHRQRIYTPVPMRFARGSLDGPSGEWTALVDTRGRDMLEFYVEIAGRAGTVTRSELYYRFGESCDPGVGSSAPPAVGPPGGFCCAGCGPQFCLPVIPGGR